MLMQKQQGFISIALAVIFGLLFFVSSGVAIWALGERSTYKNDSDELVQQAVTAAVQEAESAKETEFVEREKLPTRTYQGPDTYGSISFDYPKTWSLYVDEQGSDSLLTVIGHPRFTAFHRGRYRYCNRF
jgi:hypothetical protein